MVKISKDDYLLFLEMDLRVYSKLGGIYGFILGCGFYFCFVVQRLCLEEGVVSFKVGDILFFIRLIDGSDVSGLIGNFGIQIKSILIAFGLNWFFYNMFSVI